MAVLLLALVVGILAGVVLVALLLGTDRIREVLGWSHEADLEDFSELGLGEDDEEDFEGIFGPPPVAPPPPAAPPPELLEVLRDGECVLFAGSGLDLRAGLRGSTYYLSRLVERTDYLFPSEIAEQMRSQLHQGEEGLVAELIATRVSREEIADILSRERLDSPQDAADADAGFLAPLSRLPFCGAVTNMWSDLLGSMFHNRKPETIYPTEEIGNLPSLLRSERFFVAQVNGAFAQPETLQLGWQQYRETLANNREFGRFMASLHSSRSFLFVGASFDAIEEFFDASAVYREGSHSHFALVPREQGSELRAQRLSDRHGVELLRYDADSNDASLNTLIKELERTTARSGRRRRDLGHPPRAEGVTLENIGPFESLELEIHPETTVLLGNNASGKSSILRAIALVLAGEGKEADRAAAGLLRAGQAAGYVELRLEGERYRTVLSREGTRVLVQAEQLSPVASGLWLGLGFPPLRGAPAAQPVGPALEPSPDPSSLDVEPLVGDWVDNRLGDLQQWIVNTAVKAESGTKSSRAGRRMLDTFFAIVADLTPGVDFRFEGVDHETWRVMVRTKDGLLGLDQLSRGMTAMFSWVGVLIQRLFRIYGDDLLPAQARALLLLDEVDLHLHPEWQRLILPLVRRHFPLVQMIVSTHSPLVVGSDPDAHLIHLRRAGGGIVSEALTEDFAGWRSDQILTGPAFDLSSTRDQATEGLMEEYAKLLSMGAPSDDERRRAEELSTLLGRLLPAPQESEMGRQAADLVRDSIRQRLVDLPPERREKLASEAELYLQELGPGRREK